MITNEQTQQISDLVLPLCKAAGEAIMAVFQQSTALDVLHKSDNSPVTQADIDAHNIIEQGLLTSAFTWPIISEESWPIAFEQRKTWPTYWLVDPLDGTKEFIAGSKEFTVNIALIHHHQPAWGAVYAPATDTLYWGGKGVGAWQRTDFATPNCSIQADDVAERVEGSKPLRVATSVRHGLKQLDEFKRRICEIYPNVALQPRGSSLKFCAIAAGEADIYPRFGATSEWDTAAGQAVLEGAGGRVSAIGQGHSLRYNTKSDIINPAFIAHGTNAEALLKQLQCD